MHIILFECIIRRWVYNLACIAIIANSLPYADFPTETLNAFLIEYYQLFLNELLMTY